MENLNDSGLILKTLKPVEYTELINDLNYNFLKILNLPGFKGVKGDSIEGQQGVGLRGSKWIFIDFSDMSEEYNLTDYAEIDIEWINSVYNQNAERFFNTLTIPNDDNLLIGDILVLPDGNIITLIKNSEDEIKFVDSGITFNDVASVSESRVAEIFNELYSEANTGLGAIRHYRAVGKNSTDDSPQLNQEINQESSVDILTSESGSGVPLPNYSFLGVSENATNDSAQLCQILGSPKQYHDLIQATQENFNNDYTPGIDDFASLVVLQNNNKSGMLFGNKSNNDLRKFSRLYNRNGSAVLTSSNSPNESEYSEFILSDVKATIRALRVSINSKTTDILSENFNSNYLNWDAEKAHFGYGLNRELWIGFNNGVFFENIKNANILTTDEDGKLIKKYTITENFDNPTHKQTPTTKSVDDRFDAVDELIEDTMGISEDEKNKVFMTRGSVPVTESGYFEISSISEHGTHFIPKGTKLFGQIGGRTNPTLASDGLLSVKKWYEDNESYEKLIQKIVVHTPFLVPQNTNYESYLNSDSYNSEVNKNQRCVLYRKGSRTVQDGQQSPIQFGDWVWEFGEKTMFETNNPLTIEGSLKNNNLQLLHKVSGINFDFSDEVEEEGDGDGGLNSSFDVQDSILDVSTKIVRDVDFDDYGHAKLKKYIQLKNHFLSYVKGGVSRTPWSVNGTKSTNDAVSDMIDQRNPKTITTPSDNFFTQTQWTEIDPDAPVKSYNSHNMKGHKVQYKIEETSSNYSTVYLRYKNNDQNYLEWNADNSVFGGVNFKLSENQVSGGYSVDPVILVNGESVDNNGWSFFKFVVKKPQYNVFLALRITINRV